MSRSRNWKKISMRKRPKTQNTRKLSTPQKLPLVASPALLPPAKILSSLLCKHIYIHYNTPFIHCFLYFIETIIAVDGKAKWTETFLTIEVFQLINNQNRVFVHLNYPVYTRESYFPVYYFYIYVYALLSRGCILKIEWNSSIYSGKIGATELKSILHHFLQFLFRGPRRRQGQHRRPPPK